MMAMNSGWHQGQQWREVKKNSWRWTGCAPLEDIPELPWWLASPLSARHPYFAISKPRFCSKTVNLRVLINASMSTCDNTPTPTAKYAGLLYSATAALPSGIFPDWLRLPIPDAVLDDCCTIFVHVSAPNTKYLERSLFLSKTRQSPLAEQHSEGSLPLCCLFAVRSVPCLLVACAMFLWLCYFYRKCGRDRGGNCWFVHQLHVIRVCCLYRRLLVFSFSPVCVHSFILWSEDGNSL